MNGLVLQVAAQCCEGKENTTCILKSFYINNFWFMYFFTRKVNNKLSPTLSYHTTIFSLKKTI